MDDLGIGDETPGEQLARQNLDGDLRFLASLRDAGERLGASSRVKKSLARRGDDPRLSDLRRYAHAIGLRVIHVWTPQVSESQRRDGEAYISFDLDPSRERSREIWDEASRRLERPPADETKEDTDNE